MSSSRAIVRTASLASLAFGLVFVAVGLSTLATGCGGAEASAPKASPPHEPPAKDEPEPRTVEEAQEQIARLQSTFENEKKKLDAAPKLEERSPTTPSAGSTTTTPESTARQEHHDEACSNPCRALMSMKRAVDALCRMTGDADNRCVEAKKTLTQSTTRVSPCKCA